MILCEFHDYVVQVSLNVSIDISPDSISCPQLCQIISFGIIAHLQRYTAAESGSPHLN